MEEKQKGQFQTIINTITELRYYLGEEVFSVTKEAIEQNEKSNLEIAVVIQKMSKLASLISALVFEAKGKENLSPDEEVIINRISLMATKLGNMQFKLAQIKRKREEWEKIIEGIRELGGGFAEELMDLQTYTRDIITDFKELGFAVPQSDLASLLDATKNVSTNQPNG